VAREDVIQTIAEVIHRGMGTPSPAG
jgi:hypothetical protein